MKRICSRRLIAISSLLASATLWAQIPEPRETIITSERLEMQGTPESNYFYFTGNVKVNGTNLEILCSELTIVAKRKGDKTATIGEIDAIQQITARGSVEISQAGRRAYAGLAEVNPQEGTVTLSENPRIIDGEVEVEGYQFILHKGERKFESVPDPNAPADAPSRSIVRLGAMPDMGFDQSEEAITVDDRLQGKPEKDEELAPEPEPEEEGINRVGP